MSHKLLVIEDDLDVRESLREILSESGYAVACAAEGGEALALLDREAPAVILLDLSMPGMDGYQFMAELRRRPRWQATPVMVLTAQSPAVAVAISGATAVVRKPIDLDELLNLVARLVAIAAQRQRQRQSKDP